MMKKTSEKRLDFELDFDYIIDIAKEIRILIGIFNEPELDIRRGNKQVIDSNSILKNNVLKKIIKKKLEFLRDEVGINLKNFDNLFRNK